MLSPILKYRVTFLKDRIRSAHIFFLKRERCFLYYRNPGTKYNIPSWNTFRKENSWGAWKKESTLLTDGLLFSGYRCDATMKSQEQSDQLSRYTGTISLLAPRVSLTNLHGFKIVPCRTANLLPTIYHKLCKHIRGNFVLR